MKGIAFKAIAYGLLFVGAGLSLIPFFWMVRSSFMTTTEIFHFPPKLLPETWLWGNFLEIFNVVQFSLYFKNTLFVLIPVIIGTVVTSCMCGYGFARLNFPGRNIWFALIIATMMLPPAVTLIPTFMLWTEIGGINTFWPLVLPSFFGGGGFFIFLMRQFFMSIPKELDEAALIDGANYVQIFVFILLPLVKPAILVVSFFTFTNVWNDFFGPLIYLNDESMFTLALGLLQLQGSYTSDWNLIMAAATVMTVPAILIFFLGQKYFVEGITLTGIKG
ncbi:carbohydrate ABC transporter permease [Shouchella patagoniensis]|uniref:carbohydrate ABC transporter permease n=1 Tax=Shouchella patagoniensis TaxID=228576 RepID=UPI001472CD5C|nr:carbohydrate ABC transporter permease [Shouchella patagoniensis]